MDFEKYFLFENLLQNLNLLFKCLLKENLYFKNLYFTNLLFKLISYSDFTNLDFAIKFSLRNFHFKLKNYLYFKNLYFVKDLKYFVFNLEFKDFLKLFKSKNYLI